MYITYTAVIQFKNGAQSIINIKQLREMVSLHPRVYAQHVFKLSAFSKNAVKEAHSSRNVRHLLVN